jgi:hypothetical protein
MKLCWFADSAGPRRELLPAYRKARAQALQLPTALASRVIAFAIAVFDKGGDPAALLRQTVQAARRKALDVRVWSIQSDRKSFYPGWCAVGAVVQSSTDEHDVAVHRTGARVARSGGDRGVRP